MDIQFKHQIEQRRTFAVIPPADEVLDSITASAFAGELPRVAIEYGVAKVHPLDHYCKKTGRKCAQKALKREHFLLQHVAADMHGVYFDFKRKDLLISFYRAHDKMIPQLIEVCEQ